MTCATTRTQLAATWSIIDRGDGRWEICCPHGIGHPSQRLSALRSRVLWQTSWMDVHGCDGCCGSVAFRVAEDIHVTEAEQELHDNTSSRTVR